MSINGTVTFGLSVVETLATNVQGANTPTVNHNKFGGSTTLNASSTPPGTTVIAREFTLSSGALTIDFTSVTGTNGLAVDASGLKLQAMFLKNKNGNASMAFGPGASNGYNIGGDSSWKETLTDNSMAMWLWNDDNPDVAAGAKTIDVAGTGAQSFEAMFIFG